ncbi:MAG: ATP-binding protein [Pseudomonadota bacterium]|nr:ATP-binding protein [Pseudomonadota bacterium]MDO7710506.1 ATP-binding protein [Pseudomonadota bacterium]
MLKRDFEGDYSIDLSETDGSFDASSDILVEGYKFGSVEVGFSIVDQKATIDNATNKLVIIAVIELIFVALFSLLLGIMLTKRLILLKEAAVKLSQGEIGLQIPLKGTDEVTEASKAFNIMSSKIADVTEKLHFDNSRMDAVMNTATDSIFMISLDGQIQSVNQAAFILFDYKGKDIIGQNMGGFIPDYKYWKLNDLSKNVQLATAMTSRGKKIRLEIHSSMTYFNNEQFIVGVIRDLTLIDELEHELEAVFDLSENGFLIVANDQNISYVNKAFYSIFNTTPEACKEAHDWPCFKDFLTTILDSDHHIDLTLLEKQSTPETLYLKLPEEKIVRVTRQKIDKNDNNASDILFFVDITHETIVDRMKSEFLSTAAHELRTPLASVMGFSELLSIRDYNPEKTKEIASNINRQAVRLKALLDDLLDIARIEDRAMGAFDMQQGTLEAVLTELIIDISASDDYHFIDFQKPAHWPTVEFDPSKIRQIFSNILSNAFKYSPKSSKIMVSTAIRMADGVSVFGVIIEDTGIGMTPNELSHVGERFYRADKTGNIAGTGLGISLTKEFVKIHNGQLDITSTIGKGTMVIVWLPITILIEHIEE